jgi:hypothetical protein
MDDARKTMNGMTPSFSLDRFRDKWREIPRGSDTDGRILSADLLALPDADLLAQWDAMAARRYDGELGWLGLLYGDTLRGGRILELGSGLGFDGLRFVQQGAHWTFADIVPDNLAVIRRVAGLKALDDRVRFHLIGDDLSFAGLPADYDVIWAFGSIHHVPFEMARREALAALGHLKPRGRWMELAYTRERWLREGSLAFDAWGRLTDGERTPWAEWHDIEKVRCRLAPAPLRTVLDFEFGGRTYRWLDLQYAADRPFDAGDYDTELLARSTDLLTLPLALKNDTQRRGGRWSLICPPGLYDHAAEVDLAPAIRAVAAEAAHLPGVAVDIDCQVESGAVGLGLRDAAGSSLPAAEAIMDGGPEPHHVTLRAVGTGLPATLMIRNLRAGRRSTLTINAARLRVAN